MTQTSTRSWEFFTTLDYEWNVCRGRLPYRWTIWVGEFFLDSFAFLLHIEPRSFGLRCSFDDRR